MLSLRPTYIGVLSQTEDFQAYLIVKPGFEESITAVSATWLWQDGYSETGSGPLNWSVDGISKTGSPCILRWS